MAYLNVGMPCSHETKRNFYSRKRPFLELNEFFTPRNLPGYTVDRVHVVTTLSMVQCMYQCTFVTVDTGKPQRSFGALYSSILKTEEGWLHQIY